MPDYITKIFEMIHLSPRHLFGISILGLFLLFTPEKILIMFGIQTMINDYRPIIGIITLFSIFFYFVQLVPSINNKFLEHKYKKKILEELHYLSKEEKVLLLYCLEHNQKTISLPISHSVANRLKSKGIFHMATGTGNMTAWAYSVDDIIWNKLQKDKTMLLDNLSDHEIKNILNNIFDSFYN